MRIDTHAHVFLQGHPVMPNARHAPTHDALADTYVALLDRHGLTHGLLTAPSFYGTDNSLVLAALRRHPQRLRGTVTVEPGIGRETMREMAREGVVGIRFNLFGVDRLPDFYSGTCQALFADAAALDWHVEIFAEGPKLHALLPPLLESGVHVVVDHFGRPDPAAGAHCTGFRSLLEAMEGGNVWAKLSAPYRLGGVDPVPLAQALLAAGGVERLLWGSDWPWTQNAAGMTYERTLHWLEQWVPDEHQRAAILGENPARLFGLEP